MLWRRYLTAEYISVGLLGSCRLPTAILPDLDSQIIPRLCEDHEDF